MYQEVGILKDRNKQTAVIAALLLHALLLLLMMYVGLTEPFPKIEEIGMPMRIRLGTTETGSGNVTAPEVGSPAETPVTNPVSAPQVTQNIATQTQQTMAVKSTEEKVEETTPVEKPVEEEKKKQEEKQISSHLKSMLDKYKNKSANSGGSSGTGTDTGNQGAPDGHADGGPDGGSLPGGGSYKLKGRGILSLPKIEDKSQEDGKVVVDIVVDRNGDVVRAIPGGQGSTTTSSVLLMKAREAAFKAKFSPNPNAPMEQYGQMTFVFILR